MRRAPRPIRADVHPQQNGAGRVRTATLRRVAGGGILTLLSVLFWFLIYQNIPDDLNGTAFKPFSTAGTLDRTIKLFTLAVSAAFILSRWSTVRQMAKSINPGLIAFMVLAPLSFVWSIDASATLLRSTTLISIILLALAIPLAGWNPRRFQQVAIPPMMFILGVSLLIGIVNRDAIIEFGDGISLKDAWRGLTHSKNQLGMMASAAVIVCLNRWLSKEGRPFWSMVGVGVSLSCLILSRSSTSLFATLLGVLMMVLITVVPVIRDRFSPHAVIGICATILIYQLAIQGVIPGAHFLLEPITQLTGKDMTFSSRTAIWEIIKQNIAAHPYLGSGYAAYWTGAEPGSPSYIFVWLMYFYPTESHNGYLEIRNDFGVVGLLCLILFLAWYVWQGLQLLRFDRSQAAMYLGLLCSQMVVNMSESEWFSRASVCNILILSVACLSRELHERRRQEKQQASSAAQRAAGEDQHNHPPTFKVRFMQGRNPVPGRAWRRR